MIDLDDYVSVAKLGKAHGVKGEVRMFPYPGFSVDFASCHDVVLSLPTGEAEQVTLKNVRFQAKCAIARFLEVSNRDQAEVLTGAELLIREDLLPRLDDGEMWYEYVDVAVFTEDGEKIGRVKRVFETGAHPIMVVSGRDQEFLIPVTPEIVIEVDLPADKIVISPPLGLLEIND